MMKQIMLALSLTLVSVNTLSQQWHVAKTGSDSHPGTAEKPWLTISKAAEHAKAGDEVVVHEGVYREQVNLNHGGLSDDKRVIFRAAENESVAIKGSERIKGWTLLKPNTKTKIWKVELNNDFFKQHSPSGVNPYRELVRYPKKVVIDTVYGETGWQTYGYRVHRGNVFINDSPLKEVFSIFDLEQSSLSWMVNEKDDKIILMANFSDLEPNEEMTEILVREKIFAATHSDVNYVTLQGLTLHHAATHWAPPTVYQPGAVEPNGSTHWIIEDNNIAYSRAVCISVGVPVQEGDIENVKNKGHHVIRNNKIHGCGQAGIAGQAYADHSVISHNRIEGINLYREFGGWETSGIKVHHNDYSMIDDNFISGVYSKDVRIGSAHGIWIDYQNTQLLIRRNIIMNTDGYPVMLEANWDGPFLVSNNIFVGSDIAMAELGVAVHSSLNAVWAHNLFVDTFPGWLNQQFDNRPAVKGGRWFNNMFIGSSGTSRFQEKFKDMVLSHNLYMDGAKPSDLDKDSQISSTETNFSLKVENDKVLVSFDLSANDIAKSLKSVNQNLHQKGIQNDSGKDVPVVFDMLNQERAKSPQWGPFENIRKGSNDFSIQIAH